MLQRDPSLDLEADPGSRPSPAPSYPRGLDKREGPPASASPAAGEEPQGAEASVMGTGHAWARAPLSGGSHLAWGALSFRVRAAAPGAPFRELI